MFIGCSSGLPRQRRHLFANPAPGKAYTPTGARHIFDRALVLIGESLARRLFGSPEHAIGQTMRADRSTPTVVRVMPSSFRFPSALETIWWPLDLAAWSDNCRGCCWPCSPAGCRRAAAMSVDPVAALRSK